MSRGLSLPLAAFAALALAKTPAAAAAPAPAAARAVASVAAAAAALASAPTADRTPSPYELRTPAPAPASASGAPATDDAPAGAESPAGAASPGPAAAAADAARSAARGDAIFAAVRANVARGGYPRFASYRVRVTERRAAETVRDTWQTYEDLYGATVYAKNFSTEERANPSTPTGINVVLPFFGNVDPVKPVDLIGPVAFAADQTYGIGPARGFVISRDLSSFYHASNGLPVIGRTQTSRRLYDVRLLDTGDDGRGLAYHLKLTPVADPSENRLRELWVSAATMLPTAAIVRGIGNRAPTDRIPWRVEFVQLQGGTYLARESALGVLDYGSFGTLTGVDIDFLELTPSSTFPFHSGTGLSTWTGPLGDP